MKNNSENRFRKANMIDVQPERGEQEIALSESSLRDATETKYVPAYIQPIGDNYELTPIQKFYNGQSIFITGGTGFIGKLLIEKLLRECPGITCIYLLIRTKKGKSVHQRMKELIENSLFSTLREKQPTFQNRIVPINGDCTLPNLDISMVDRATLIREVSIIFHVAATVKFNEKMKLATEINVRSVKDIINLSKEMSKLKSVVHVSTAYSNCFHIPLEEKFYDPPIDPDELINLVNCINEKLLDDITPQLLGIWPNTYVYTKTVAENLIRKHADSIPLGIFRPGMVISTYREPIRGWIDNRNGPTGITTNVFMGLMRTHHCDGSINVDFVPGDLTTNGIIASAWEIANNRKTYEDIPIYNYVSKDNPFTYGRFIEMILTYGELVPFEKAIWCPIFEITKYRSIYLFYVYFLHLLPALIIDTLSLCTDRNPRLFRMYNKIHEMSNLLSYFSINEKKFTNERWNELLKKLTLKDRELFYCDMKDLVWNTYFETYFTGVRKYILKDPIETLPQARIKWRRFYLMHQGLKLLIACVLFMITWAMISRLLVTFGSP
ncbi:fatty acyl-CoA reductase wat-like isoform X2 [Vespa crabro]|uniref:fatty acyl-CoA reductase wat-like isoform X2 n=1 Tax=Vespa crabro TaxID=7445 RepID=UPI001F012F37|nr:fatty acyl-CoA reductase wat-like isoform X2 [Vespa crabro]